MEKFFYYSFIVCGAATVFLLFFGLVNAKAGDYHKQYMEHGTKADGTITELVKTRDRSSDTESLRYQYFTKFDFSDQYGNAHAGSQPLPISEWEKHQVGQSVVVTYLRDNPAKSIVYLDALAAGEQNSSALLSQSALMAMLCIICFSAFLYLGFKRVSVPVLAGENWIRAEVEVANKVPSRELIDRLALHRINVGFNVPLPEDVRSGELPWVQRALEPTLAATINVGGKVAIRYPRGNLRAAVLEQELQ